MSRHVVCHMLSSVDGRLLPERWSPSPEDPTLARAMETYLGVAEEAWTIDAALMGRVTVEDSFDVSRSELPTEPVTTTTETFVGPRSADRATVVFDSRGVLEYPSTQLNGGDIIVVLGAGASEANVERLREQGISYLFAGADGHDVVAAVTELEASFGLTQLQVYGGGTLNGAFLAAGLLDEISVLVQPAIDGLAGVPTIYEAPGEPGSRPAANLSLRLLHAEPRELGTVWLRYAVDNAR